LISIGAVPGVFAGIATILYFTNTTLNIESFMGSIMSLGVSVSNSVMLVTFINDHWKSGKDSTEASMMGSSDRLRPILMTACAMTIGMVPMALALERGSQMQAPLGLAVIGGLIMSTFATLLMIPPIFTLLVGQSVFRSPSIYPADPDSPRYDPRLDQDDEDVDPIAEGPMQAHPDLFEHWDASAGQEPGIGSNSSSKPAAPTGVS
jgi:predicted RND superfamily exporter protein